MPGLLTHGDEKLCVQDELALTPVAEQYHRRVIKSFDRLLHIIPGVQLLMIINFSKPHMRLLTGALGCISFRGPFLLIPLYIAMDELQSVIVHRHTRTYTYTVSKKHTHNELNNHIMKE